MCRLSSLKLSRILKVQLLNIYEDRDEAETARDKIAGEKRLASERDSTQVIYNLFGEATWSNFYKLSMFNLPELQKIVKLIKSNQPYDKERRSEILRTLEYSAKSFGLEIPQHWR